VVIGGYIDGVRKRYVNPVSFFGVILTLNGLNVFILSKFYKQYLDASKLFGEIETTQYEVTKRIIESTSDISLEYASFLFSLLIPVGALVSVVVYYNKKYNYTEHVILYLYTMSVYSVISVVLGLTVMLTIPDYYMQFGTIMYVFIFVYHCYVHTRVFKLNLKQLALKILLFVLIFFILYVGVSILAGIIMLLTGVINIQDFAPKK
jgi:hypothetical protein